VELDADKFNLSQLMDIEARLGTSKRIKSNYNLEFDYSQNSLGTLLDMEARLGTARRLKAHDVDMDYKDCSLSQLLDAEARVSTAARIKRASGVQPDWQHESLASLMARESSLSQPRSTPAIFPTVGSIPSDPGFAHQSSSPSQNICVPPPESPTVFVPRPLPPVEASRPSTSQRIGNTTFDSDGGSTQRIGNTDFHSDGSTTQKIGNTYFNSDGGTTQKIGTTQFHSDGTTTQKIGNTYFHSDGSTSQRIGNTIFNSD